MSDRILLLGGGIAGAATAWWLARFGVGPRVVLLEREDAPGQHSTGQNAALLSTAIEASATRRMALETADFLARPPEGFAQVPLLERVGLIVTEGAAGDPEPAWVAEHRERGVLEALHETGRRRRAPHFEPAGERAWWLPACGRVDVAALLDGFLRGARRGGVTVRTRARVTELLRDGEAVVGAVLEDGERVTARWTVLAAGGWAGRLGEGVGASAPLAVTRRHLLVTGVDLRVDPRWPVVWDDRARFYARPESGGLLVSACDQTAIDPDRLVTDPDVKALVAEKVARHLPGFAEAPAAHFWAGLRTLSPDDTPLVGPAPHRPGLFWLAGLGGHGISISAALGRAAAARLVEEHGAPGGERELLEALDPVRFARGGVGTGP